MTVVVPKRLNRLPHRHGELVRQLGRSRLAEEAAPLAGIEKGAVDAFLHVAARFLENFAHLAGFDASQIFFVLAQKLADPIKQLAALGRGNQAPAIECFFGRLHGGVDILFCRCRKHSDQVVMAAPISV